MISLCQRLAVGLGLLLATTVLEATPPDYVSLGRIQSTNPPVAEAELLRIWLIFVGQGDGILVELPDAYDGSRFDSDSGDLVPEPMNVLIDAGSYRNGNANRARDFINTLYPTGSVIEHAVISHHDADHVKGFTGVMQDNNIDVDAVYHNGLASYAPDRPIGTGVPRFPRDDCPSRSVCKENSSGAVTRGMARFDVGGVLQESYLINDLGMLKARQSAFQGVYAGLARAILDDVEPEPVNSFHRVKHSDRIPIGNQGEVRLQVVWPRASLRVYENDWGKTINGNSVSLHLSYETFEMLFTGDHNEESEPEMVTFLRSQNQLDLITGIDILKIPHHGSGHSDRAFFGTENEAAGTAPTLCLA